MCALINGRIAVIGRLPATIRPMNDLARNAPPQPATDHAEGVPARWSLRRSLTLAGAAAAVAAATLSTLLGMVSLPYALALVPGP